MTRSRDQRSVAIVRGFGSGFSNGAKRYAARLVAKGAGRLPPHQLSVSAPSADFYEYTHFVVICCHVVPRLKVVTHLLFPGSGLTPARSRQSKNI